MPPTRKIPTQLVRCDVTKNEEGCGLLQLAHTLPPEILYANYWYRSATNSTMRDHLKGVVTSATSIVGTVEKTVLDIGCNDGTLLNYYPDSFEKFGVDPSDIAREISGEVTVVNSVFPSQIANHVLAKKSFDVITSIAMFYDLEDPVEFSVAIQKLLNPDGIWILEVSYLPIMLEQNSFDTICHEHLEYYSLAVLEHIAQKSNLRIFNVELNAINGGSIRCYLCHADNASYDTETSKATLHQLRISEFDKALDTDRPYRDFQDRIEALKIGLLEFLRKAKQAGKTIHVYGASTKGNVLLQWCGIDNSMVDFAADRNPLKVGAHTLGTEIPIIDESDSRAMNPDFYLVLPWHFKKEFLERERDTIVDGASFIFPLPELSIVSRENFDEQLADAAGAGFLDR